MRDEEEARKIRATYSPVSATVDRLNQELVVDRISIQAWRTRSGHEQKLVTYRVSLQSMQGEPIAALAV